MNPAFAFVEISALVLFGIGFFKTLRIGKLRAAEFLLIAVYGVILEYLDMKFFKSYHYSSEFLLSFHGVPVSIALLWAVIVAGAMAISDAFGIPVTARPFVDGLLALWIDLGLDAIAIRMGYWHWSIPLDQGWFGVPAGNLYAWMWVAFFYSVFARTVRMLTARRPVWGWAVLAVPLLSYLFLFIQLNLAGWAGRLAGLRTPDQRLWLFAAQFLVFAFISFYHVTRNAKPAAVDFFWTASRIFMHAYFLVCYFLYGFYREVPALGGVAVVTAALEILVIRFLRKAPEPVRS